MSKLPLHDSQVDLDEYNASNTAQYHPLKLDVSFDTTVPHMIESELGEYVPPSSPLIGQKDGG